MKSKWLSGGLFGLAMFGVSTLGCTITSGSSGTGGSTGSGTGGSSATGGSTGSGGSSATGGSTGSGGAAMGCGTPTFYKGTTTSTTPSSTMGPCDIYAADGGACVAAHSTVRALYAAYSGPLYQVRKSDCTAQDIMVMTPGGMADSASQDAFCGVDACTISVIYDQSGKGNHLTKSPAGERKATPENEANAKSAPIMLGGQKYYGIHIVPGVGYRNNAPTGTATGDNPETEYMIVAGNVYNGGCCFDYGNMETTSRDDGEGTMEAVYFGSCTTWNKGAGSGPWVMGDLENGLWAGNTAEYDNNMPVNYPYVTGMVKGDVAGKNHWTIKEGDATTGMLIVPYDGKRPSSLYNPMKKEGAIGLGTGGDATSAAQGNWFEGVMTAAYSSDAADNAVQASIVSVYGKQ